MLVIEINFIVKAVEHDIKFKKIGRIVTRFPPEPNGPLHLGHLRSVCLNVSIPERYTGLWKLRFDDTNPNSSNQVYADSITRTLRWLGFKVPQAHFASDHYSWFYDLAVVLIRNERAYVDDQKLVDFKLNRGTLETEGKEVSCRRRGVAESVRMFKQMKFGRFRVKTRALRARINMKAFNWNLRDPVFYRISFVKHHRTKHYWCVHPTYDFAQCISDYLEGITHSLCTLEFASNRDLYNWFLSVLVEVRSVEKKFLPVQLEFSRLICDGTPTSKRLILKLFQRKMVRNTADLRLFSLVSLRRQGFTKKELSGFVMAVVVAKSKCSVQKESLRSTIRRNLEKHTPRELATINSVKMLIENIENAELISVRRCSHYFFSGRRRRNFSKRVWVSPSEVKVNGIVRLKDGPLVRVLSLVSDSFGSVVVRVLWYPNTQWLLPTKRFPTVQWTIMNWSSKVVINLHSVGSISNGVSIVQLELSENDWLSRGQRLQLGELGYFVVDYNSLENNLVKFNYIGEV